MHGMAAQGWMVGLVSSLMVGCSSPAPPTGRGAELLRDGASAEPAPADSEASVAAPVGSGTTGVGTQSHGQPGASGDSIESFYVVASLPGAGHFMPVDGRAFLVTDGPTLIDIAEDGVRVDGNKVAGMEKPFDALRRGEIATLAGRWPDDIWLALNGRQPLGGATWIYRWAGDRWAEQKKLGLYATGSTSWVGASSLVLLEATDGSRSELLQVPTGSPQVVPRFTDDRGACRMIAKRLQGFGSGELVVQGLPCASGAARRGGLIGYWPAGGTDGVIEQLPDIDGDLFGIAAMAVQSPKVAYVAGWSGPDANHPKAAYLARFDGNQAHLEKPPMNGPLIDLTIHAGSVLWAIEGNKTGGQQLWRRGADDHWSKVALPSHEGRPLQPARIWARGPGDLWLVAKAGRRYWLLHTQQADQVVELLATQASEYQSLGVATASCSPLLVILDEVSEGEPPRVTAGRARGALGGAGGRVLLVEYRRRGKLCLGVVAYTLTQARSYAELAKQKLSNADPRIVCHEPRNRLRMFVYDPATGQWQAGLPGASR